MAGKKARDIMSEDCTCIGENDSVLDAAKRLAGRAAGAGRGGGGGGAERSAPDLMSEDCPRIGENGSGLDAAKRLAELDVGAMPICGEDDRLKGMIPDRDIVVEGLAQGEDPAPPQGGGG